MRMRSRYLVIPPILLGRFGSNLLFGTSYMSRILSLRLIHAMHALTTSNPVYPQGGLTPFGRPLQTKTPDAIMARHSCLFANGRPFLARLASLTALCCHFPAGSFLPLSDVRSKSKRSRIETCKHHFVFEVTLRFSSHHSLLSASLRSP